MIWAVALAAGVISAVAVVAWHMRKPNWRRVRFSGLKFLPDLDQSRQKPQVWSLRLPLRSSAFWLRLLMLAALIWALFDNREFIETAAAGDKRIGLRVVLDASASMGVGDPARFDLARDEAVAVLEAAREAAGTAPFCHSLWLAARDVTRAGPVSPEDLSLVDPVPGQPARLALLAGLPDPICPRTHVVVISDAPRGMAVPEDVIWRMVGPPVGNVALTAVGFERPGLLGGASVLSVSVRQFGAGGGAASVVLTGPGGMVQEKVLDLTGLPPFVARFEVEEAGSYEAVLTPGGALAIDDRVVFEVARPGIPAVDWRLAGVAAPGLPTGQGVVVARYDTLSPAERAGPFVATASEWTGGSGRIGVFTQDTPLLAALNLDVFERFAPGVIEADLPEGFVPVIAEAEGGRAYVAVRQDPPAVLLPDPSGAPDGDARNLALTLFYTALEWVLVPELEAVRLQWKQPGGALWRDAGWESDTARPLAKSDALTALRPVAGGAARPGRLWPWLLVVALLGLAAERVMSAVAAWR